MGEPERPRDPPPVERGERLPPDELAPATVAQFKGLRRWLVVAGVWAIAATALAVFALIQADREDEEGRQRSATQVDRVERGLNDRIDGLEQRVDGLPTSEDVSSLDERLGQAEDDAARAAQDVERLGSRLDDLEGRVDTLEQTPDDTATETAP